MNERVVHTDNDGNQVVSTQSILNAKGPFGAIDALDPNARLNLLIEGAVRFRKQNPDAPVRAPELAVNEVLRLRKLIPGISTKAKDAEVRAARLAVHCESLLDRIAELQRPFWQKMFKRRVRGLSFKQRLRNLSDTYFTP